MSSTTEEVKSKIDIVDYIGTVVELKRAGRNFKANCPFHSEHTPSFMVSPERQTWRCFGACQEGGDVISFLMKWENFTFYEALKELAQKAGVKLKSLDLQDRAWQKKEVLLNINNLAEKYYHYILTTHKAGSAARDYLKDRGVNEKIIETFMLGFSPSSWGSLQSFLKKKGVNDSDAVEAGLLIKGNHGLYDRFRARLMFPIKDPRGQTVGFSGRLIINNETQAKYVNTPETPLYLKRQTLYGIDHSKEAIKKEGSAIIVEGEFDMLSLYQAGISNVVAIKGSALTRDQLMLLKRFTNHIILSLDSDFSGGETTRRAVADAESLDFKVEVSVLDFAKDPDEAVKTDLIKFKKIIKKPIPVYDFIIDHALQTHNGIDAFSKKEAVEAMIPYIIDISNPIIKDHYIKKIARSIDSDESSIEMMIRQFKRKVQNKSTASFVNKSTQIDRLGLLQQYILSVTVQSRHATDLLNQINAVLGEEDFTVPAYHKLISKLTLSTQNNSELDINKFVKSLPTPLQVVFDELFLFDVNQIADEIIVKDFGKSLLHLKRYSLKQQIKEILGQPNSDENIVRALSVNLTKVEKELAIV